MSRILSIDYGLKRCGLAWTDPLQLIATGIGTMETAKLPDKLAELIQTNTIECLVLGYPTRLDGSDTDSTSAVRAFEKWFQRNYPDIPVQRWDERFSSKLARQAMLDAGLKRKKRRDKALVDQISATLILQDYLQSRL